ncbi:MAG: hypothetical protein V1770_04880 [bacterium]
MYFETGYINEAFENFEAARTMAYNEQREELYQAIMKEIDELENSKEMKIYLSD